MPAAHRASETLPSIADGPDEVLRFWRAAQADWFSQSPAFDERLRRRFLALHGAVVRREHDDWARSPEGSLALLILLDQFPRNAFRGTARMYATDPLARHFARLAQAAGHLEALDEVAVDAGLGLFFALPFAHSEALADQQVSVMLNARLGQPWLSHAEGHRDIIRRFGRFPHRNRILGRTTTPEEQAFLDQGGFAG